MLHEEDVQDDVERRCRLREASVQLFQRDKNLVKVYDSHSFFDTRKLP